jgi:hypothetical protein
MLKNWQKISLALSSLSVLVSAVPVQAGIVVRAPFEQGGYRYAALAMNSYCENFYTDGKMVGNRQIQGNAWHSPRAGKNIRCEYWAATTHSTQAGVSGEVGAEVGVGIKGTAKAGVNGSRTDNKTAVKLFSVTNFSYSNMCKFQQGTSQFIISRDKQVIYCGRPI